MWTVVCTTGNGVGDVVCTTGNGAGEQHVSAVAVVQSGIRARAGRGRTSWREITN